jgi:phosphatidylglycerophosphate synthase
LAAANQEWDLALFLLLLALCTDFLDGLAAKKLNAKTRLGAILDPLTDFLLAAAGVAGLVFAGLFPLWGGLVMLAPSLLIGYVKFFLPEKSNIRMILPMFSVIYLFGTWIFVSWAYASQAWGWSWWLIPATFVLVTVLLLKKRHRVREWFAFILKKPGRN